MKTAKKIRWYFLGILILASSFVFCSGVCADNCVKEAQAEKIEATKKAQAEKKEVMKEAQAEKKEVMKEAQEEKKEEKKTE